MQFTNNRSKDQAGGTNPEELNCAINVRIGEVRISKGGAALKTSLGSCVSTLLYDHGPSRFASLSHFLLPKLPPSVPNVSIEALRYGEAALPKQIQLFQKLVGAHDIRAMIFGGASMYSQNNTRLIDTIGKENIEMARQILKAHMIPITEEHVGGSHSRSVTYNPAQKKAIVLYDGVLEPKNL